MKLGKMLSVGEVVEHPAAEETTTVAELAPASTAEESVTESADSAPPPAEVVSSVDR
jgi:hypothetical protein